MEVAAEPSKEETNEEAAVISTYLKGYVEGYAANTRDEACPEYAVELFTWSEYLAEKAVELLTWSEYLTRIADEAVISTDLKGCVEGYEPENETQDEPNEEAAQKEEEITEVNAVIPQDEPKDVNTVKLKDELTTSDRLVSLRKKV